MLPDNIPLINYTLPNEKIAKYPLPERDASKLLLYKNDRIEDRHFYELPGLLPADSLMVFNESKVVPARLIFSKETGAVIEIFCLEPANEDPATGMARRGNCLFNCMIGNAKRWKSGTLTMRGHDGFELQASRPNSDKPGEVLFEWQPASITFAEVLSRAGKVPLPPYLKRESEASDFERYQTIYARQAGSVAAPTAGLHFTPNVYNELQKHAIQTAKVALHVGAGTFKPVTTDDISQHAMHAETFEIDIENLTHIHRALQQQKSVTAVGTTSMRTLESLYALGVKALTGQNFHQLEQWEAYRLPENFSPAEAVGALISHTSENTFKASTGIMIVPGYPFKIVNQLITNFHQPDSTLLYLVAAFVGQHWEMIYNHALLHDYRFLSYGDSSLLYRT